MINSKTILNILLLFLGGGLCLAQTQTKKTVIKPNISPVKKVKATAPVRSKDLFAKTLTHNKKIYLRWVPSNIDLWRQGIRYGYIIERIPVDDFMEEGDSAKYKNAVKLNKDPIFPMEKENETWNKLIQSDPNSAFVHQSVFDWEKNWKPGNTDQQGKQDLQFGFFLKACDNDFSSAFAAGLAFIDSISNGMFIYRISLAKTDPNTRYTAAVTAGNSSEETKLPATEITGYRFFNKKMNLTFNAKKFHDIYGGFNIERSEDAIHFTKLNSAPVTLVTTQWEKNKTQITYTDTFGTNGKQFFYRIKGLSFFGIEGGASEVISGKGKSSIDGYPFIDKVTVAKNNSSEILFHYSAEIDPAEVKGVHLFRSEKEKGPFRETPAEFSGGNNFTANDSLPLERNYYRVALDLGDGDTLWSSNAFVKIPDTTPPHSPKETTGKIDSNGIVKLSWLTNQEKDLLGYRVFRSNSLNEEFVEVTKNILKENFYTEKLQINNLTEEAFYRITAVDKNYNNSPYTSPIKLKKPDNIAPSEPLVKKLDHTDSSIVLEFYSSTSKDVQKHFVERTECKSGKKDSICILSSKDTLVKVIDKNIKAGKCYSYQITCFDDDGNKSSCSSGEILFQPKYVQPITKIKISADREKRKIILSWDYPQENVFSFVVYKARKGEKFHLIETLKYTQQYLEDKEVSINNIYVYKVKAILKSGTETHLGNEIEINY